MEARQIHRLAGKALDVLEDAAQREPGVEPVADSVRRRFVDHFRGRIRRVGHHRLVVGEAVDQGDEAPQVGPGRLRVEHAHLEGPESRMRAHVRPQRGGAVDVGDPTSSRIVSR